MPLIPVIDLFAGPGGLGEGFSRESSADFRIAVSIEKDPMAFETLRLRAAFRQLQRRNASEATWAEWDRIIAEAPWPSAFRQLAESRDTAIQAACRIADDEALNLELGPRARASASAEIRKRLLAITGSEQLPRNAVLIGGPPCQAYSLVGRARNRGTAGYKAEADHRHFLYLEYLHVIAEFEPAIFVMENVKGILTSKVKEAVIFDSITRDLKHPASVAGATHGAEYVLCTLSQSSSLFEEPSAEDFLIRAEEHGVPQARHRVIILGVRKDVFEAAGGVRKLDPAPAPSVLSVIGDLPPLRPQLSYRGKGLNWLHALRAPLFDSAVRELRRDRHGCGPAVAERMLRIRDKLQERQSDPGHGSDRYRLSAAFREKQPQALANWYHDRKAALLANHESRSHMPSDLIRYLFVAAFGEETDTSPRLHDFPKCLLPAHKNVDPENVAGSIFKDRFRVQVGKLHAMTVTSHIAKDGHAFIHPRAVQCRSLTVREAARLQTFPDSYVFLGNRTSQYTQVGNAVPPYLARQIASVVADTLKRARLDEPSSCQEPRLALAA
ncbi:DNA cytosine methyltransferase [Ramlibacter sp. USB13]|uniref:DNA (cytosine-5-)-methyltransferase n=1 Tax=Ramlibacter cellulosilyticus TaxID=2764187 RepID=A0A923SAD2_9BURK|nr:DNA cytosine methyltransferase [Ramlibacter cellulosilyticus]MBC5782649.1 DNA cytosine methyltransferase [Ramlibacter cellulosilyticus]